MEHKVLQYDAVVVGAGMVGVSTAWHVQRRGMRVALLDRRGVAQETTYGCAGVISAGYALPFAAPAWHKAFKAALGCLPAARMAYPSGLKQLGWLARFYRQSLPGNRLANGTRLRPLAARAIEEHKALMRGTAAEELFVTTGRVSLYRSAESFARTAFELQAADLYGVGYDVLSAQEMVEIEPALKPNFYAAVRWQDSARMRDPALAARAYAERFIREGGTAAEEEVTEIIAEGGGWKVKTRSGRCFGCRHVVLCTGPWVNTLLAPLGVRVPLGYKRGYHRHFTLPQGVSVAHGLADADIGYFMTQTTQGLRITTGAEFADPDSPSHPVQLQQVLPYARELLDIGDPVEAEAWVGARPCCADSLPVIGDVPQYRGLWLNAGHGHTGFSNGPASGRLLAEMLAEEPTFCDPSPYALSRLL